MLLATTDNVLQFHQQGLRPVQETPHRFGQVCIHNVPEATLWNVSILWQQFSKISDGPFATQLLLHCCTA